MSPTRWTVRKRLRSCLSGKGQVWQADNRPRRRLRFRLCKCLRLVRLATEAIVRHLSASTPMLATRRLPCLCPSRSQSRFPTAKIRLISLRYPSLRRCLGRRSVPNLPSPHRCLVQSRLPILRLRLRLIRALHPIYSLEHRSSTTAAPRQPNQPSFHRLRCRRLPRLRLEGHQKPPPKRQRLQSNTARLERQAQPLLMAPFHARLEFVAREVRDLSVSIRHRRQLLATRMKR